MLDNLTAIAQATAVNDGKALRIIDNLRVSFLKSYYFPWLPNLSFPWCGSFFKPCEADGEPELPLA